MAKRTPLTHLVEKEKELEKHIKALGFRNVSSYKRWCKDNGFSDNIYKPWKHRNKELEFAKKSSCDYTLHKVKKFKTPQKVIEALANGQKVKDSNYNWLVSMFDELKQRNPNKEIWSPLLHVSKQSKLLQSKVSAHPAIRNSSNNTFLHGICALLDNQNHWIRSIYDWKPNSHNVLKQFCSLSRHLLVKYEMPVFMDSVWFMSPFSHTFKSWYLHIANGGNIRKVSNISLTKKMANHFMQAPDNYTIDQALVFGKVLGMGGDYKLVDEFLKSRAWTGNNNYKQHTEFWDQLLWLFINNAFLDRNMLGELVDYIISQKFEGHPPPHPGFSIKGRTAAALLEQSAQWHRRISRSKKRGRSIWEPCGISEFRKEEGILGRKSHKIWTITELLSSDDLHKEGRAMRHCVYSYARSCVAGRSSIWSLKIQSNEDTIHAVTIEINMGSKRIVQAKKAFNKPPTQQEWMIIEQWAAKEGLSL